MMGKFLAGIYFVFILYSVADGQTSFPDINQEIEAGNFTKAQQLIAVQISEQNLSAKQKYELQFQSELLDRIRQDFNRDEKYVRDALSKYYPNLTDQQLREWERSNELEMKIIDGQKKYFWNAVLNLFRANPEARRRKIEIDGTHESKLDSFLQSYLPKVVNTVKTQGKTRVMPVKLKLTYTLTVDANAVPAGEIVRAWLPFPRSDRERLTDVELINTSEKNFIISPKYYVHQSLYMEKKSQKDKPTVFEMSVSYTGFNEWQDLNQAAISVYNKSGSLYKMFTAEREPHIVFTPEIKALSDEIILDETDPLLKAKLIYKWIGKNIPWTRALEYSTIPNISMYCASNMRGDCGIKSLLFITLCRYNGVPAKWQSGWFLYPVGINLHDWAEVYFEGVGWVPVDPDFNDQDIEDNNAREFFFGGADAYRFIVNNDFSGDFFPAKIHPRSETVDFQRGEVEWRGGNLYFNQWDYHMEVEYPED
jgi:hypothetical protein